MQPQNQPSRPGGQRNRRPYVRPDEPVAPRTQAPPRRRRARTGHALVALALVLAVVAVVELVGHLGSSTPTAAATADDPAPAIHGQSTMDQRIVAIAQSQLGYTTDPSNTYCNKFSAFWDAGNDDCHNSNLDEEWCADFAAWVWQKSGALVTYQFINGDINSSAASFYEWGIRHDTWHPAGRGYIPEPGDVAVYGLDVSNLVAAHVAVVIGYKPGNKGPNVVNGDGDTTGFSVVELGVDQYKADGPGSTAYLSGYTSPTPAP